MGKSLGLVVLVVALSATSPGFHESRPTGDVAGSPGSPAVRPLDVVTSSVVRGTASLRPPGPGIDAREGRRAEIDEIASDLFDVDDMARRALARHWKDLVAGEQDEFVRLFEDTVVRSFTTIVERYTDARVASVNDEVVVGTFATVHSRLAPGDGPPIDIEYRLSVRGVHWRVYDIVFEGVSLVSRYRSRFDAIMGTSSVAQLLERMRTEPSRHPLVRDAHGDATSAERETEFRTRLAVGLLLGVGASSGRRR